MSSEIQLKVLSTNRVVLKDFLKKKRVLIKNVGGPKIVREKNGKFMGIDFVKFVDKC